MTFEEYHEINSKYGCKIMPFDISLNKFTKEEYEDMIRAFLQSGLVVRCLPPKEKYTEYINVTVEGQDTENTKEDRMLEVKKLNSFMEERRK